MSKDEKRLKHIRERHSYLLGRWSDARKEAETDIRYSILNDPWDADERTDREKHGRLCLNHDELRQYINQAINSVRQNKRGINVDPEGDGANADTATIRKNIIRTIEHNSQAQGAYITAYESALRRGYGFFRIGRRYKPGTFDQEIYIKTIKNPDSVLYDWDCTDADWGDAKDCFVETHIPKDEFKHAFPRAAIKSFTTEMMRDNYEWIALDHIVVAEYWSKEIEYVPIVELLGGEVKRRRDLRPGEERLIVDEREDEVVTIVQEICNGVEILKRTEQPGTLIPIIPVIGEEVWTINKGKNDKILLSLTRLARDPQKTLAYFVTQQTEEAGLLPKVPYIGYKGQFETDAEAWANSHRQPYPFLQVDPVVDEATGHVLPKPERNQFTPNFAQYQVAIEGAKRAIQAAMGLTPLPTSMQKDNLRLSGIAQERLNESMAVGSFHFVDNYDRAIALAGRVINGWIDHTYNKPQRLQVQKDDDSFEEVAINYPYRDNKGIDHEYSTARGKHLVSVSAGPSAMSQIDNMREPVRDLIANLPKFPLTPAQGQKIIGTAIRLQHMGPLGDQLADNVDPPEDDRQVQLPPEIQAQMDQMQQQMAQLAEYTKQKEAEVAELKAKIDGKIIDNTFRERIEKMKLDNDLVIAAMRRETESISGQLEAIKTLIGYTTGIDRNNDAAKPAPVQQQNTE